MKTRMHMPVELETGCVYVMSLAKIADGTWGDVQTQAEWERRSGTLLEQWTPEQKAEVFQRIVAACN